MEWHSLVRVSEKLAELLRLITREPLGRPALGLLELLDGASEPAPVGCGVCFGDPHSASTIPRFAIGEVERLAAGIEHAVLDFSGRPTWLGTARQHQAFR